MRRHKYGAKKTACHHGHIHDSKRESDRCNALHLLQLSGVISELKIQDQFWFIVDGAQLKHSKGRRAGMLVDFTYTENGRRIAEDSKGVVVRDYPLRAALFRHCFPEIELREV